jgi:putative ABC transport system permease protein
MAEKYFGDEDPINKTLKIIDDTAYGVTGVVKNISSNSHLTFNMLCSYETLVSQDRQNYDNWMNINTFTYLLLAENADYQEVEKKFPALIKKNLGQVLEATGGSMEFFLQPLNRIHLYSNFELDIAPGSNITYVYLFSGIALFVLIIAGFNFINLSTARSAARANEVGVRKTFGAQRSRLIKQFLSESVIFCFLSLLLALVLLRFAIPLFNSLSGRELAVDYLTHPLLLLFFVCLALFVGIAAGIYPAFFLSSFSPVKVLKGSLRAGAANSRFRSILVITQFVISIALIIGTLTIYQQIKYMKNKSLGFNKEHVVVIPRMSDSMRQSFESIRGELKNLTGVVDVAASSRAPGRGINKSIFFPEGFTQEQPQTMDVLRIDHNYIPTMDMEIVAGRNFSKEFSTDPDEALIINETAAKKFGWEEPVGKTFLFPTGPGPDSEPEIRTVVGVVKDFHITSLHLLIDPLVIFNNPDGLNSISIRISPDNIPNTLDLLENKWKEIAPNQPFDYFFLDEFFDSRYRAEEKLGDITLSFSFLAIFIGCLGLFGMASFTAERRTKEIGIRKVLGASITGIVRLLSKEFLILVAIANVVAWPIAYFGMKKWLQNFAYRMDLSLMIFVLSGALALFITLLSVSYQAIKAALANPVNSIRYE